MNEVRTFRHAHLACGIGAGARGFNLATPFVAIYVGAFLTLRPWQAVTVVVLPWLFVAWGYVAIRLLIR